jgi:mono/diheme cytochrome c family protein
MHDFNTFSVFKYSQNAAFPVSVAMFLGLLVFPAYAGTQSRGYSTDMLRNGQMLYQTNCASCHGVNAGGTVENWQERREDGKMPPPPLNGTAHTWHHPIKGLAHTIRNGTQTIGGNMPPWKNKLSNDEIFSIIIWLTSLWSDEVYNAWLQRNNS